jgi:hypothetical protein
LRRYRLCDFIVESELELPELADASDAAQAEAFVRCGQTPRRLTDARQAGVCFMAQPGELMCWLAGVARFYVKNGREIVVEADPGVSTEAVRSLLFSSPLAGLLLQRGTLPLQGSAVTTAAGALIFAGSAAVGKSTLAAEFRRRGFEVFSDAITAVAVPNHDAANVLRVSSCMRLWPDAIGMTDTQSRSTALRPGVEKRLVLGDEAQAHVTRRLVAVICLERRQSRLAAGEYIRLLGTEAVAALLDAVYRPTFVRGLGCERAVFAQLTGLVRSTAIVRFSAPDRLKPAEIADRVLEEFAR